MIREPILLLAFMFAIVAFARWLEGKVSFVEKISSAVVCTLLGIGFANSGVIPFTSATHEAVFDLAIPYAIVLVILGSDMRQLARAGRPVVVAYLIAVAGSFAGGLVGGLALAGWVGPETWKLGGTFAAAFAGGGMNFAAVGQGLEIAPGTFAAAAVADNLSTVPYLLTQVALVGVLGSLFARRLGTIDPAHASARAEGMKPAALVTTAASADEMDAVESEVDEIRRVWTEARLSISDAAVLAALPLAALWVSRQLVAILPAIPEVLWLTTLALLLAQIPAIRRLRGATAGAYFALHVFFIVLGSSSILAEVANAGLPIFSLMILIIVVHMVVAYGLGWLARLDLATVSVASQAAIGGPGSALALSMSMKWHKLVAPGIIVGIFGYALGNYLGFACAYLLATLL